MSFWYLLTSIFVSKSTFPSFSSGISETSSFFGSSFGEGTDGSAAFLDFLVAFLDFFTSEDSPASFFDFSEVSFWEASSSTLFREFLFKLERLAIL